jgi:hypothetical protein
MRWRLLPPLIAHLASLPGKTPLLIPWLGLIAATTYVARILQLHSDDWRFVLGGTLLFATTSAAIVPITWFGINDAWVTLGLLIITFERSPLALAGAALLCPWVDERFIIGLPLAWTAGCLYRGEPLVSRRFVLMGTALAPYVLLRLGLSSMYAVGVERAHLSSQVNQLLVSFKYGYLGWWMGLRAAWAPIAFFMLTVRRPFLFATIFLITAAVMISLTEDQSKSAAIATPVAILGLLSIRRDYPIIAPKVVLALGIIGLLLPATHVGNRSIVPYDNLLVELVRWYSISS